jgi:hypothetical protein
VTDAEKVRDQLSETDRREAFAGRDMTADAPQSLLIRCRRLAGLTKEHV